MKICMIGLGSIGKRHLGNLKVALEKRKVPYQIEALRSSKRKLEGKWDQIIDKQYYSIDKLPNDYDVIYITNPTFLHYETIKKTVSKTRHIFIEKPVFESVLYNISELNLKQDSIYYVACPLRHKRIMAHIKQLLTECDQVISARVISSSYLPAWRKNTDYRNVYSAMECMGGGVTRDLIHEWDYVIYLFGSPSKVINMKGNKSELEIDSDDISIYMAEYPDMFLEMHLDYFGHKNERNLQLFTTKRRIDIDLITDTISEYKDNQLVDRKQFPVEDFYMNETEYFLDCIEGRQNNINTIENACHTLKIALTEV